MSRVCAQRLCSLIVGLEKRSTDFWTCSTYRWQEMRSDKVMRVHPLLWLYARKADACNNIYVRTRAANVMNDNIDVLHVLQHLFFRPAIPRCVFRNGCSQIEITRHVVLCVYTQMEVYRYSRAECKMCHLA